MISGIYRPNYDVPKLVENVSKMSLLKDTPASALKKRHRIVTCSSKTPLVCIHLQIDHKIRDVHQYRLTVRFPDLYLVANLLRNVLICFFDNYTVYTASTGRAMFAICMATWPKMSTTKNSNCSNSALKNNCSMEYYMTFEKRT